MPLLTPYSTTPENLPNFNSGFPQLFNFKNILIKNTQKCEYHQKVSPYDCALLKSRITIDLCRQYLREQQIAKTEK
jgi:hypothetical protein